LLCSRLHLEVVVLSLRLMICHRKVMFSKEFTMEPWMIAAREGIRDLTSRYNSNGDSGRFDEVRPLFHDDAEMHVGGRAHVGLEEIMTIFTGTKATLHASDRPKYIRHFTATHKIDLIDEDRANGRLYFCVLTSIGVDHWGVYTDTYLRKADGVWRFARRVVKVDGRVENSLFRDA
jgi:SnoaL-like domain